MPLTTVRVLARVLLLGAGLLLVAHAGMPAEHIRWIPAQCTTVLTATATLGTGRTTGEMLTVAPPVTAVPSPPIGAISGTDLPTRQIALLTGGPAAIFLQMLLL